MSNKIIVLSDDYINQLFEGTNFGAGINNSTKEKKCLIVRTLQNQISGYWSGHTAYHIAVNGGFLKDSKKGSKKKLTALGHAFLQVESEINDKERA